MIDRRPLMFAAVTLMAAPTVLRAQAAGKLFRIGVLGNDALPRRRSRRTGMPSSPSCVSAGMSRARTCRSGPVCGWRHNAPGRPGGRTRGPRVDLIFTRSGTLGALAAKRATSSIPIVMFTSADPVASGLVASLSHPGGNVTGNSIQGLVLGVKRLEILAQIVGKPARLAYLQRASMSTQPTSASYARDLAAGARALGVELQTVKVRSDDELPQLFGAMRGDGVAGVVVDNFGFFALYGSIASLAVWHRLAPIAEGKGFADAGGLAAYGVNYDDLARRAAIYVDKILRGAKASDLPVEQASKFELYFSLKTARALGLGVPQALLLRADEVIE